MKKDIEFQTVLSKIKRDFRSTRTMLIVFCIVAVIARFLLKVPIPLLILFLIFIWFLLYFAYEFFTKKAKTGQELYNLYFKYNIVDTLFLTLIIHYLGGVAWIGVIFYILVLVMAGVILPKKQAIILGFIALFFYSILVFFEYFGIISHKPIFLLEPNLYQSLSYVATNILVVAAFFFFVAETAGTFSEILKQKTRELQKAYEKARNARKVLEIRVKARTKQLNELTEQREEVIKQRTKELQEKIEELGRFHKLAVGRELKMIELKEEIKNLKTQISNLPSTPKLRKTSKTKKNYERN